MVSIDKTTVSVPAILAVGGKGQIATDKFKTDFDNGTDSFRFSSKIYGHKSVKEALKKVQHGKCCFCESKVAHISHGDVEHFRPKGGYNIKVKGKLIKPGYYWLAYDFFNLYFSCQICNQSYKKNLFPIADESVRANSHHDDHNLEDCLIIDPGREEPSLHLYFEQEVIMAKVGSTKGKETIKRTGLDRKKLEDHRLEHLIKLEILAKVARDPNNPISTEAALHFKELGKSQSVYSLMVCSNFPDLI